MPQKSRRAVRIGTFLICLAATYAVLSISVGLLLARTSLQMPRRIPDDASPWLSYYQRTFSATTENVSITAADGAVLQAWYIAPARSGKEAVILLHGIGDSRAGIVGFADFLLARGYAVLVPDSRAHGRSGGQVATFGILERDDVRRWTSWLRGRAPGCTFLLGESMGAAIGLEATAVTPQLCAVVVESPYTTFRSIAFERLGRPTHLGAGFWRTLGRPSIEVAIWWSRWRYGVWLPDASPLWALEHSRTPALLIAGTADRNIPMHHAQELAAVCGSRCSLWIVPGADHGGASVIEPEKFHQLVLDWFAAHDNDL